MFRFFAILTLALWLGSIFFFGAVLAPTVFHVLPTHTMAGNVVFPSLSKLHTIGFVCGALFIIFIILANMATRLKVNILPQLVLVILMLVLTAYAQFGIGAKMDGMRLGMGEIDAIPQTDARRVEFNRLHVWSTRIEGTIFFLGLGTLFLSSRRLS
jgi:hypothetical protein